jgi:hypothetical protein
MERDKRLAARRPHGAPQRRTRAAEQLRAISIACTRRSRAENNVTDVTVNHAVQQTQKLSARCQDR